MNTQLEPDQSQEFPLNLTLPGDQSSSALGEPERRWTLTVTVLLDAPQPGKPQPYEKECSEILKVV